MADSWEDEVASETSSEEEAEELKPAAEGTGGYTGTGTVAGEQGAAVGVDLTGDGGVRKLILREAPADAPAPSREDYVCVGEFSRIHPPTPRPAPFRPRTGLAGIRPPALLGCPAWVPGTAWRFNGCRPCTSPIYLLLC